MSEIHDLVQQLSAITAGTELAESRQIRSAATEYTQGSYQALFNAGSDDFRYLCVAWWLPALLAGTMRMLCNSITHR